MADTTLPVDRKGLPIQALTPSTTVALTIGAASVSAAIAAGTQILRLAAAGNCHVKFGSGATVATASDFLFPVGAELFVVPAGADTVAVIQAGAATGAFTATRMV